ncbi:MAG: Spy/CpxP family protein refolding chaperone [Pseudomonadales bacterium]|nr:Spy/CpxP family protein refolding chaperone [Pseudomonadales bacterium]
MIIRNLFLSVLISLTLLATLGAVLASTFLPGTAIAAWHGGGTSHSALDRGAASEIGEHCDRLDPVGVQLLEAYLIVALDLSDAQRTTLAPAITVIDEWRSGMQQRCEGLNVTDAPSALREMAGAMTITQTSMTALVPAFDAFYASLTPAQQTLLNDQINHRRGG